MTLSVVTQLAPADSPAVFAKMLSSVKFADDITVYAMDLEGNPELAKLRKAYRLQIKPIPAPPVVEHIRTQQVQAAPGDWVLIIDFDEVVTPALAKEIVQITSSPAPHSTYRLIRQNFSLGYPLKYGGWGTDYVIRLFRRADFVTWPTDIHSTPQYQGTLGTLKNYLEHHKDQSLEYIVDKTNRYSDKEAAQFLAGGLPPVTSFTLLRKLKMEMLRRGLFKRGLLDGAIGLIQSIYQGFSVFLSYAKLYELQQSKLSKPKPLSNSNHK